MPSIARKRVCRTGKKAVSAVVWVVLTTLLFGLLTGFCSVGSSGNVSATSTITPQPMDGIKAVKSLDAAELSEIPVTMLAASTFEKSYVYDGAENKLFYNRVTGMVFSEIGVVYNQDSQPLTYDDETEQFEDSLQRRMELVERSTHGLQNYYLMQGSYKVRSIGITDTLYITSIAAKTAFNSGEAYDMLVTRVYVKSPWYMWLTGNYGSYTYYDLFGHEIDSKYFQSHNTYLNFISGMGTANFSGKAFTKFEKWGTIQDLLDEIVFLMEIAPPTGSPMGEFALDTVSGAFLRDDRGQKIRIKDEQLIDPMGWPLIGADARPLWWRENFRAYTDHRGRLLQTGAENKLTDTDGFVAHSVISNVIGGKRIYLVYVNIKGANGETDPSKSGKFMIPATAKTVSVSPYKAEFYDMNGVLIPEWELIEPEVSVDDRKENWPEEFPEPEWLLGFRAMWDSITGFFSGILSFLGKYGLWILLGIIFLVTLPVTLPLLLALLKLLAQGVWFIITLPVRLIKKLFKKDGD